MNFEEILDHATAHAPAPRTRHLSEEVYDREPSRYQNEDTYASDHGGS
jgi:hypothetical protein